MKKFILLFLSILSVVALVSCKKEKEDINTPKEFNTGDIVTYNGVIYEYIDIYKDIPLEGEAALEYIFEEEEEYKAYYNYYYLDMSDYKNQPKLREDKSLLDPWSFNGNPKNIVRKSPTEPYAFFVLSYLDDLHLYPEIVNGSFIVKGYNEELPEDVEIPEKIHGKYVTQIGYRAFENASMKTLKASRINYIHPYGISHCNNLTKLDLSGASLMSMAINNCNNLISINTICPYMDCCLYNLPNLKSLERTLPVYYHGITWGQLYNSYGLGGIRKSFFYNCPRLESITGKYPNSNRKIKTVANTVYLDYGNQYAFPIYVFNDYTAVIDDVVFTNAGSWDYTVMYNPETYEAYVPFLNDGLEKKGTILFKHEEQGPEAVTEDETGIYINATYFNPKYNAKLLFKKK